MKRWRIKIRHPEWLEYSSAQKTIDLYRSGKIPESIAGWMIVVGLKHPLRAVYGSELRAALALLWWATGNRLIEFVRHWVWANITHRAEWRKMQQEENQP